MIALLEGMRMKQYKQYQALLWDLDGTLLDTSEGILASVGVVLEQEGIAIPDRNVLQRFIGPPIEQSFASYLKIDKEEAWRLATAFRQIYKSRYLFYAKPYPGIRSLLSQLQERGRLQAVATYKREDYATTLLEKMEIAPYFTAICGADLEGKKSKTDIMAESLEKLHGTKGEALMIGDSRSDAIGAANNGVDFLAVLYGFGFRQDGDLASLSCASYVKTVAELADVLGV